MNRLVMDTTDQYFYDNFLKAVEISNLSDQEIAEGLKVSLPTIKRWKEGKNFPNINLRAPVLNWFVEKRFPAKKFLEIQSK
jgi:hypothetical protein